MKKNPQLAALFHSSNAGDEDHGTSSCHLDVHQNENNGTP